MPGSERAAASAAGTSSSGMPNWVAAPPMCNDPVDRVEPNRGTRRGLTRSAIGTVTPARPATAASRCSSSTLSMQVWTAGQASLSGYILLLRGSATLSASPSATLQVVVP
jgi:hypothetical protein